MFLLMSLSKYRYQPCRTRVVNVYHSCRTCVALASLVSHSCRTRVTSVALMLYSCRSCLGLMFSFHIRGRRRFLFLMASYCLHKKFQRNQFYYIWIMTQRLGQNLLKVKRKNNVTVKLCGTISKFPVQAPGLFTLN